MKNLNEKILNDRLQSKVYLDAWTFIETLIVMAIILILTASVGFSAVKQLDKARIVTAKSQLESFSIALDSYYMDIGSYPTQEEGLNVLWQKPQTDNNNWNGPYLSKPVPKDPWGNNYNYILEVENLPYGVASYGKDGMEGGEGNDADICSWK